MSPRSNRRPSSPAFQVYPEAFLGSPNVSVMTTEEIGAYWLLLLLEWSRVGFEYELEPLARFVKMPPDRFAEIWEKTLSRCFKKRGKRWYNPRLDRERIKQREYRENGRKGGITSGRTRALASKPKASNPPSKKEDYVYVSVSDSNLAKSTRANGATAAGDGEALTAAALAALAERWPGFQPAPHFANSAADLAARLRTANVPLEAAIRTIQQRAANSKRTEAPNSVLYFERAILEAHELNLHSERKGNGSAPRKASRLTSVGETLSGEASAELERLYQRERRLAGSAWAKAPENANAYKAILDRENAAHPNLLTEPGARAQRDVAVLIACAEAAHFPTLDAWKASHVATIQTPTRSEET